MKVTAICSSELGNPTLNPTFCLSAFWGLNECHRCNKFIEVLRTSNEMADVYRGLRCIPRIEPGVSEHLIEYFKARNDYKLVREKLYSAKTKLYPD